MLRAPHREGGGALADVEVRSTAPLYASLPRYSKTLNPTPPPSPGQTVLPPSCCRDGREAPPCLGSSPSLHPGDCFLLALTFLQQHAATLATASVAVALSARERLTIPS